MKELTRELTEFERYVLNPIFALIGLAVVFIGVGIIRYCSVKKHELPKLTVRLGTIKGYGLIFAGLFLAAGAVVMTVLGRTLLPS